MITSASILLYYSPFYDQLSRKCSHFHVGLLLDIRFQENQIYEEEEKSVSPSPEGAGGDVEGEEDLAEKAEKEMKKVSCHGNPFI